MTSTAANKETLTGSIAEVAAFFGVSERTVGEWKDDSDGKTPLLGHWQEGRNVVFGEQDIVDLWVKRYRGAKKFKPGELEERARREWREFKGIVDGGLRIADLEERVAALEQPEPSPTMREAA